MKNKKKIKLPLILIILILVVSVGYALLTSEGSIHGWSMLADSKWDIHFTNLIVNEGSTDLSEEDSAAVITEDNTQVTYRVTLNKPGDFYEFTVDVKNFGTIDGMVNLLTSTMSIDGEDSVEIAEDKSNLPEYLDYSITYNDGTKIDKNHELKTGEYETYKVRVEFKKDITADQLPTEVKTILFNITPEFTQANEQAIEKDNYSPFITRASLDGLRVMDFDIDYDKCMEMFGEDVPEEVNIGAYCRGENITYQGQTLNLKQQISYYPSYYEEMGLVKNIK